jgi:hypothetical protein
MKKNLLLFILLLAFNWTSAKSFAPRAKIKKQNKLVAIPLRKVQGSLNEAPFNSNPSLNLVAPSKNFRTSTSSETSIGLTAYDLQSNCAISNRLLKHNDGTISAVWTMIYPGGISSSRGTGYNYFNGSSWGPIPTIRIEPIHGTAFPNIVVTTSGREMVFAHSSSAPGMLLTSRLQKGSGAWTSNSLALGNISTDTWSKAINGGANGETVHSLWNANSPGANQQFSSVYYSRSIDGGITWPVSHTVISDIDSTHYRGFGGDAYSIDTKGDTVVFVVGDFDTDLILMRSTDNGVTWASTVIQPFFQSFYNDSIDSFPDLNGDGNSDLIEGCSGDAHVMIDNLGKVHVWWSNVLMTDTSASALLGFFPNAIDGLLYWNDGFANGQAPDTIAFALDGINANGILDIPQAGLSNSNGMGNYRGSITQMPTSGVDANNNLYVAYQTYCEDCDTSAFNTGHKHIYMIGSTDQGATWSNPTDIDQTPDLLNFEDVFACVAKNVDANCIHVIYQRDAAPGHSLSANATEASWNSSPSEIIYACVDPIIIGIKALTKNNSTSYLSQNTPNPAEGKTTINYNIAANASVVSFTVSDVLGNVVYTENKGTVNAGTYSIVLNTEAFNSGVYFYTLTINNQKETKKMMVK